MRKSTPLPWILTALVLTGNALTSRGQTLPEALDTPGRTWTPSGTVQALNDAALSHDGVDVVRLDPATSAAGPFTAISTVLTEPSIVEFQYRGQEAIRGTTLGIDGKPSGSAFFWQQKSRFVEGSGSLTLANLGASGSAPLYLDAVSIRPAVLVSLAEALDWPGTVETSAPPGSGQVLGMAESWLAPDGVDAVRFSNSASSEAITFPVPTAQWLSYRSTRSDGMNSTSINATIGALPHLMVGDRTWLWMPIAGPVELRPFPLSDGHYLLFDALETPSVVPLAEALDYAGPGLASSGQVLATTRTPDAADGDAVLCLGASTDPDAGTIRLALSTPSLVRFAYRGNVSVKRGNAPSFNLMSASWKTHDLVVLGSGETVVWQPVSPTAGFWLHQLEVIPLPSSRSVAGLLDAPGLVAEFPVPVILGEAATGPLAEERAVTVTAVNPAVLTPVIRLPFEGPALVSLRLSGYYDAARVRINGGPWQSPAHSAGLLPESSRPFRQFISVVEAPGSHVMEVSGDTILNSSQAIESGPIVLDQFVAAPLVPVPFALALSASGLAFTTGSALPWQGFQVPSALGVPGNLMTCGSSTPSAAESWIETQITGPGVLQFRLNQWSNAASINALRDLARCELDGFVSGNASLNIANKIWIPNGTHTVRWTQLGGQVPGSAGPLAELRDVSFLPKAPSTIGEALGTPRRVWATGGAGGDVQAGFFTPETDDGLSSVRFRERVPGGTAWIETPVQLPCRLSFRGINVMVTLGDGTIIAGPPSTNTISPSSYTSVTLAVPGTGPALLRLSFYTAFLHGNAVGLLDNVVIHESKNELESPVNFGTPGLDWTGYTGQPMLLAEDPETGDTAHYTKSGIWIEAMVTGPGAVFSSRVTLPDYGNRIAHNGNIPFAGPTRVLTYHEPGTFVLTDFYRPFLPVASLATPGVTWSTGGEVAWYATSSQAASGGALWPGETSWIEAEITGPGEFSWNGGQTSGTLALTTSVTCDGLPISGFGSALRLHLSPGLHRVRWSASNPLSGVRNNASHLFLSGLQYTPQPSGSVSAILSGGTLSFTGGNGWQIAQDPTLPGPVMRTIDSSTTDLLRVLAPLNTQIAAKLKMEADGSPLPITPDSTLGGAAPFPWSPTLGYWPVRLGYRTSVGQVTAIPLTPSDPVTLAEALDAPAFSGSVGSTPPGLFIPRLLTTPTSSGDPDGLSLMGANMGDTAWLESTITGPVAVLTRFAKSTGVEFSFRVLVNGVPAADEGQAGAGVRLPAGPHLVRWEITALHPLLPGQFAAITNISTTVQSALPDIAELLDAPGVQWAALGSFSAATAAGSHDGMDALVVTGQITFAGNGPALVSFWSRGNSINPLKLDDVTLANSITGSTWQKFTIPIPQGRHSVRYPGGTIDEFSWQSLTAISAAEALDAASGVTVFSPDPDKMGAAAYQGFTDDGTDALMLMPGVARRFELAVPAAASLSLRFRAVSGNGSFGLQDLSSVSTTTRWATQTFSTRDSAGLSTIYLRANNVPVMIDKLVITVPANLYSYFPWADSFNLTASQRLLGGDPDRDGITNQMEYASGLDPLRPDASLTGSETSPGLPMASLYTAGVDAPGYLELRYWRRTGTTASVETAEDISSIADPSQPLGWAASSVAPISSLPGPAGWTRHIWRSTQPTNASKKMAVRVRHTLPY